MQRGEKTASEIGSAARYAHLDVSDDAAWSQLAKSIEAEHAGVDVLVNNAGIMQRNPVIDCSPEEFRRVLDVNLTGAFLGMRALAPLMAKNGGGAIVNVSSIQGIVGRAGTPAYTASKFGLRGLTKTAALELGTLGVRVNSIHPGGVDTPLIRDAVGGQISAEQLDAAHANLPIPRIGRSEDMAGATLFLASDDAAYITGTELIIDGGMTAGYIPLSNAGAPEDR